MIYAQKSVTKTETTLNLINCIYKESSDNITLL